MRGRLQRVAVMSCWPTWLPACSGTSAGAGRQQRHAQEVSATTPICTLPRFGTYAIEHSRTTAFHNTSAGLPSEARRVLTPARFSMPGWAQVLRRCVRRVFDERLLGEAAAVAFYALLAIFPALASLVLLSGTMVDPVMAAEQLRSFTGSLPAGASEIVGEVPLRPAPRSPRRAARF